MIFLFFLTICLPAVFGTVIPKPKDRSFVVGKNCFLKDGQPFQYISGTIHYWRQPPEYWADTFDKMRKAGLNALSTYINWNLHEPEPLQYTFDGQLDIRRYFQMAHDAGLLVILRPGPFIDAEVDMGGLPYWLLRMNSTMRLRTSDPSYLIYVERWYRKVLPMLKDMTYANGGPIITVQVENEYGSYPACDKLYQEKLKNWTLELMGPDIVLYTTDGPSDGMVTCGMVPGTLTTVDFGAGDDPTPYFKLLRKYNTDGPLVNSEFYPGWIDHWTYPWNIVGYEDVIYTTKLMLELNASFNFYPIRGGSNFGFVVGSNGGGSMSTNVDDFQPVTTSYDFDAPLTECGDPTEKYYKIREFLGQYVPLPPGPVPQPSPKGAYGKVKMSFTGTIFQDLKYLRPQGPVQSDSPLTFEVLNQNGGFVLYRTTIDQKFRDPARLAIPILHDRAIIYIDEKFMGILSRKGNITEMPLGVRRGQQLDILVHNEGRLCYGTGINDMKGILSNVTIDGVVLKNWLMYPLGLPTFPAVDPKPLGFPAGQPNPDDSVTIAGFYSGSFRVQEARDTFLRVDGWTNGYAFINGYNLGRYWPVQGPQITLYVPGVYLTSSGDNIVELFELERSPCSNQQSACWVEFIDHHILNGTVPNQGKMAYRAREKAKKLYWKTAAVKYA